MPQKIYVTDAHTSSDIVSGRIAKVQKHFTKGISFMKTALTIAGSDCSGGAGIQADIKTMMANGVYAMSAVTALTAQNTIGVSGIMKVPAEFLSQQLDAVFSDITPDAVKIGMMVSEDLIHVISRKCREYHARNIVVDPVMISTSGTRLLDEAAITTLKKELLPLAAVVTPNIPEAEVLSHMKIRTKSDMIHASLYISDTFGCSVLCKGGHRIDDADDLLCHNKCTYWYKGKHISNPNNHGTGCTLSSAIASSLAKGHDLNTSVQIAKDYVSGALEAMLDLGKGTGPMNHGFHLSFW